MSFIFAFFNLKFLFFTLSFFRTVENGEFKQFTAGGQEQQQWQQPRDPSPFCGINFQDEIFYTRSNGCEYIFLKKIHFALFSANDDSDESDESAEVGVQEMVTPLPKGANYKNKVFHCALFSVYFDYSDESDYYLDETEKEEDEEEEEGEEGENEEVEEDEVEEESSEGDFEKSETLIIFRI